MRIIGYTQDSTADGEGLRDVLFVSGCDHRCSSCHNKESWSPEKGIFFSKGMKAKFIAYAKRLNPPAVTLSGGDPLYESNYEEIIKLCEELKVEGINIWLYTGYTLEEIKNLRPGILKVVDVIVDGKFDKSLSAEAPLFRGSSNQEIHRSPF